MIGNGNQAFLVLTGALLLAGSMGTPARGQDADDLKRSVARISLMDGEVSVRRGDTGEWVAGVVNAPLLTGDRISSAQNSRAEVQFDSSNVLRMGGNGEIHLAQLEAAQYHVEIARGTVTFRILRPSSVALELDTPSVSVRPAKEGTFRISVTESGETEVTARAGDVEVFTPKGTQWVYAGQSMMARGNPADPEFQIVGAIPVDEWDRWNDTRDQTIQQSNSYQYVPQGVYGAEDLDTAGTWTYDAPYGYVWRPTVVAGGWAPYRNGRWVWIDWYGWTWVSSDTWGWAPYHYGRWFFDARLGWSWYPGAFGSRHYWSPALVGFFGYGGGVGVGVGFGFGNIGWVPLAPFETLHPWWGRGYASGLNRSVNVTNISVTSVYRNARVANGISGVRTEDFGAGRFQNVQHVNGTQVLTAGAVNGRLPVNATPASRRFSEHAVANVPRVSGNTQFFSRQAGAGQGIGAQASNGHSGASLPASAGYHRFGEPASNNATQNNRPPQTATGAAAAQAHPASGQRFGQPGSSAPSNDRPPSAQGTGGWRSFGAPGSSTPTSRQPYNPPASRPSSGGSGQSTTPQVTHSNSTPSNSGPSRPGPAPSGSTPHSAPPASTGHPAAGHSSSSSGHSNSGGHR